jgi:hypothetical protein
VRPAETGFALPRWGETAMSDPPLAILRALKGAPISIVIALKLANQPVGAAWLIVATGYSHGAISRALRVLCELQIVQPISRCNGWTLSEGGSQLLLPLPADASAFFGHSPLSSSRSRYKEEISLRPLPTNASAQKRCSPALDCRGKPCAERQALLVNLAIGYLEHELHLADAKFAQGERRDPHAIALESIEAEVNALIDEGKGDQTGLLVYRIRQLASGERRSRLTRHAYAQLTGGRSA